MLRTCKNCERPFEHLAGTRGYFCSLACYHEYRKTSHPEYRRVQYIDLTCANCGKAFQRRKQEVRGEFQFCSQSCAGTVTGGRAKRTPRAPSIEKLCMHCGKPFKARASRPNTKFCSKPCDWAYRSTSMIGDGNPNHRHGTNQTSAIRIAKHNYPMRCAVCGFDIIVEVHHIIPKSKGGTNTPSNLAVLCPNHHRMAELGMIPAAELQSIVNDLLNRVGPKSPMPS